MLCLFRYCVYFSIKDFSFQFRLRLLFVSGPPPYRMDLYNLRASGRLFGWFDVMEGITALSTI